MKDNCKNLKGFIDSLNLKKDVSTGSVVKQNHNKNEQFTPDTTHTLAHTHTPKSVEFCAL